MGRLDYDDGKWFDAEHENAMSWEPKPSAEPFSIRSGSEWEVQDATTLWRTRNGTYVVEEDYGRRSIPVDLAARIAVKYSIESIPDDLAAAIKELEG